MDLIERQKAIDALADMHCKKDCPVWNLTVWTDGPYSSPSGRQFLYGIEAQCHYKDIRDGWLTEKNDIKRAKRREYYKRKKMGVEHD